MHKERLASMFYQLQILTMSREMRYFLLEHVSVVFSLSF